MWLCFALCAQEITTDLIEEMDRAFQSNSHYLAMQNAATLNPIQNLAIQWDQYTKTSHLFSHVVSHEMHPSSQGATGRCWIFSALNILRMHMARELELDASFELSQSYLFFWDKLEKANYFFDRVVATADEAWNSRLISLLFNPGYMTADGGFWNFAVGLIEKYGVVPKTVYPESSVCRHSEAFNQILQMKLLEYGVRLRDMARAGADTSLLELEKKGMLTEVYRMLCIHMGTPPTQFDWEYKTATDPYVSHNALTPKTFYEEFAKINLQDYVCLIHSPREETPYYTMYQLQYGENMVAGAPALFFNLPIQDLKEVVVQSLLDDEPVWCGCDVLKFLQPDLGVMDTKLYNYELVYGMPFTTTKEMRLRYGQSGATHAMLFTGVHLVDETPVRWRVENSWGKARGDDGYFMMTDPWFDEYMFEAVVHKKYLRESLLPYLEASPVMLEPWDPM